MIKVTCPTCRTKMEKTFENTKMRKYKCNKCNRLIDIFVTDIKPSNIITEYVIENADGDKEWL